jgi:hypothetical protein
MAMQLLEEELRNSRPNPSKLWETYRATRVQNISLTLRSQLWTTCLGLGGRAATKNAGTFTPRPGADGPSCLIENYRELVAECQRTSITIASYATPDSQYATAAPEDHSALRKDMEQMLIAYCERKSIWYERGGDSVQKV